MSNPIKRPNSNTPSLGQFNRNRARMVHQTSRIEPRTDPLTGVVSNVAVRVGGTYRKD